LHLLGRAAGNEAGGIELPKGGIVLAPAVAHESDQGVGLFNSGGNNYSPPSRAYAFDSNFLNPLLLPPRTPMFRDINTTGFTQLLLPNQ